MVKAGAVFAFVVTLLLAGVPGAHAISIVSDTTWLCPVGPCAGGTASAVSSIPGVWATPTTGTWITSDNQTPILGTSVAFSKAIDFGAGSVLTFKVWADDTAGVVLSGSAINFAPNLINDTFCADGIIGCEADEFGSFNSGVLTGVHTLTVTVLQSVNATPFGTLVEGDLDLAAVPEPATILLLGSALAAAGVASRRFRKTEAPKA